jgi:uncharacterized repeat protein (TIGR01451 family)
MKGERKKNVRWVCNCLLIAAAVLGIAVPNPVTAKSLYVIADKGSLTDATLPVQLYDIGSDGSLTFQAEHDVPQHMLGAVGITIDSDNGFLFITYSRSNEIQLVDARNMTDAGSVEVPEAFDLAGIKYDHKKSRLYCVERGQDLLYVFDWDPQTLTLTQTSDSPVSLWTATAYGIALDEVDGLLYVANGSKNVTVYSTADWLRVDRIKLNHSVVSVAVDTSRGLLYAGGGYLSDNYLSQYNLVLGTILESEVDPDAGVMGIDVDLDTGYVYLTTGLNNIEGGDDLQGYNRNLELITLVSDIGNPTGLVVPTKDLSYNPLGLNKTAIRGVSYGTAGSMPTVEIGDVVTYGIHFDNHTGATVTNVTIVDTLPDDIVFLSADDEGVSGSYDVKTHSFKWTYASWPPEIPMTLELMAQVRESVPTGTIITNTVSISSNETSQTTRRLDLKAGHNPLNLTKSILGGTVGQITSVQADTALTYVIEFENNNDFAVTNVSVVDVLPKNVTFVSAAKGTKPGKYDATTHTCTWLLSSLKPGEAVHLELNVHVKEGLAKGTMFTNTVTAESEETPSASASAEAIIGETPSTTPELKVLPDVIRRDGVAYDLQASVIFEQGVGTQDIADLLPVLYPGEIKAKRQFIYGSTNKAKVVALFDKNELLAAVKGYGEVTLKMVGTFASGRSYSGEGTVYITKYSGN